MPLTSRWMIAFAALAMLCAVLGWRSSESVLRSGLLIGLAMLASGGAAAQGRTSLRRTGNFIGMVLPLVTTGVFGWRLWHHLNSPDALDGRLTVLLLSMMTIGSLFTVLILMKLRTADQVAERGYSPAPLHAPVTIEPKPAARPQPEPERRQ